MKPSPRTIFAALVVVCFVIVVGTGLWVSGSPIRVRLEKLDQRRVNDLQQMTYTLDSFWSTNKALPATLQESFVHGYSSTMPLDPVTGTPYVYRVMTTSTYQLCANFQTDVQEMPRRYPKQPLMLTGIEDWNHRMGYFCFEREPRTKHTSYE